MGLFDLFGKKPQTPTVKELERRRQEELRKRQLEEDERKRNNALNYNPGWDPADSSSFDWNKGTPSQDVPNVSGPLSSPSFEGFGGGQFGGGGARGGWDSDAPRYEQPSSPIERNDEGQHTNGHHTSSYDPPSEPSSHGSMDSSDHYSPPDTSSYDSGDSGGSSYD